MPAPVTVLTEEIAAAAAACLLQSLQVVLMRTK